MNRLLHCATMLGYGQLALNHSIEHATARSQFGRSIGGFKAIQRMLADMATELYAFLSMMSDAACRRPAAQDEPGDVQAVQARRKVGLGGSEDPR